MTTIRTIVVFDKTIVLNTPTMYDPNMLKNLVREQNPEAYSMLEQASYQLRQEGDQAVFYRNDAVHG